MFTDRISDVSISTVLDTRKCRKDGSYSIAVRITKKREQKYLHSGKSATKEEWCKIQKARTGEALQIKTHVRDYFEIICRHVGELTMKGEFSFDRLKVALGNESGGSINIALKVKMKTLLEEERIGTWRYYRDCLSSLEDFGGTNIPFEAVDVRWLEKFTRHMEKAGLSTATIGMRMRGIRTVMNIAKKAGLIKEGNYPFGKGKYEIREAEGRKKALSIEDISKVVNFAAESRTIRRYRDIWYFIYLCNGINVADLVQLKFSNIVDDEIRFVRQKTKRTTKKVKEIVVPLLPQMKEIIDRWGNPPLLDNYIFNLIHHYKDPIRYHKEVADIIKRINNNMKFIGSVLKIGSITTYTARHSFATVLKRSGANIAFISESLGHSDLKTTEHYLATFEKDERKKNAELLTSFILPVQSNKSVAN